MNKKLQSYCCRIKHEKSAYGENKVNKKNKYLPKKNVLLQSVEKQRMLLWK